MRILNLLLVTTAILLMVHMSSNLAAKEYLVDTPQAYQDIADQLKPGERSASTSNRNFEGRQGKGGRTHLVSPLVAAATAIKGTLASPADL